MHYALSAGLVLLISSSLYCMEDPKKGYCMAIDAAFELHGDANSIIHAISFISPTCCPLTAITARNLFGSLVCNHDPIHTQQYNLPTTPLIQNFIFHASISYSGLYSAVNTSNNSIYLINLKTMCPAWACIQAPLSKKIALSDNSIVFVIDSVTEKVHYIMQNSGYYNHQASIQPITKHAMSNLACTRLGEKLALSSINDSSYIKIYDVMSQKEYLHLPCKEPPCSFSFNYTGLQLLYTGLEGLKLWDLRQKNPTHSITTPRATIATIDPEDEIIAWTSHNHNKSQVTTWSIAEQKPIAKIKITARSPIKKLIFSSNEAQIAYATNKECGIIQSFYR